MLVLDDLYGDNLMATTEKDAERKLREATAALSEQPRARQEVIKSFSALGAAQRDR